MSVCLGCGARIRVVTTTGGRRVLIDPDPSPAGTVVVRLVDGTPRAHTLTRPPIAEPAWTPHTCRAEPPARCAACTGPLDPALTHAEPHHTTHPTCDPEPIRARLAWSAQRARDAARHGRTGRP